MQFSISRQPTSATFPPHLHIFRQLLFAYAKIFLSIVILIRFWYFAPMAICNLPFLRFVLPGSWCRLYWSHNRTKWSKKATSYEGLLICISLLFFMACQFLIDDAWKRGMSEGRALLFAYLINLFAFLGGFLWKNNKHFIVCSAVGEWGIRVLSIAHRIARTWFREAQNWWGIAHLLFSYRDGSYRKLKGKCSRKKTQIIL